MTSPHSPGDGVRVIPDKLRLAAAGENGIFQRATIAVVVACTLRGSRHTDRVVVAAAAAVGAGKVRRKYALCLGSGGGDNACLYLQVPMINDCLLGRGREKTRPRGVYKRICDANEELHVFRDA